MLELPDLVVIHAGFPVPVAVERRLDAFLAELVRPGQFRERRLAVCYNRIPHAGSAHGHFIRFIQRGRLVEIGFTFPTHPPVGAGEIPDAAVPGAVRKELSLKPGFDARLDVLADNGRNGVPLFLHRCYMG